MPGSQLKLVVDQLKISLGIDDVLEHSENVEDMELKSLARIIRTFLLELENQSFPDPLEPITIDDKRILELKVKEYWQLYEYKNQQDKRFQWEKKKFYWTAFGAVVAFIFGFPKVADSISDFLGLKEKVKSQGEIIDNQEDQIQSFMKILTEGGEVLTNEKGKVIRFAPRPATLPGDQDFNNATPANDERDGGL